MYELLIELIEWSVADHEWAYEHRAALDRLREAKALELDFHDFYGARTAMVSTEVEAAASACAALEAQICFDATKLGYLRRDRPLDGAALRREHPARLLSSTRARLLRILPRATYNERLVLGLSPDSLIRRRVRPVLNEE
jgi:hypothetical protein